MEQYQTNINNINTHRPPRPRPSSRVEEEEEEEERTTTTTTHSMNVTPKEKNWLEHVFSFFGHEEIDDDDTNDDNNDNNNDSNNNKNGLNTYTTDNNITVRPPPPSSINRNIISTSDEFDDEDGEEFDFDDGATDYSRKLRSSSSTTTSKNELERKTREGIRSMKGQNAKAKLIDSNEAFKEQELIMMKAKVDKHAYDSKGKYATYVPIPEEGRVTNNNNNNNNNNITEFDENATTTFFIYDKHFENQNLSAHEKKRRKEKLMSMRERDDYLLRESVTVESRVAFNGSWNYDRDEFLREGDKYENQYTSEQRKHVKLLGGVHSAAEMNLPEDDLPLRIAENIVDTIVQCALENKGKYEWNPDRDEIRNRELKYQAKRKKELKELREELSASDGSDDDDAFEEEMRIHRSENKLLTETIVKSIPDSLELIERMNIRREQAKARKDKLMLKKTKQKYIDKIEKYEEEIEETIAKAKMLEARTEEKRLEKERMKVVLEEVRLRELKLKQLSEKELIRRHSEHKRKKIMEMHELERKKTERARLARQEARRVQEVKLKAFREAANLEVELKENVIKEETRRIEERKLIEENKMHMEREMRNVKEKEKRHRSAATRHELCIQIKEAKEREHHSALGKLRRKNSTAKDAEYATMVKEALKKAIRDVEETEKERLKTIDARNRAYEKIKELKEQQEKHLQMKRLLDSKQRETEEEEYSKEMENVKSNLKKEAMRNLELKKALANFNRSNVNLARYQRSSRVPVVPITLGEFAKPLSPSLMTTASTTRALEKLSKRAELLV